VSHQYPILSFSFSDLSVCLAPFSVWLCLDFLWLSPYLPSFLSFFLPPSFPSSLSSFLSSLNYLFD
jgi:hypothetical protein